MPRLKFVQRWGTGIDNIDIETAGKRGVLVANSGGANAPAVAELTVGLMLSVYRNIVLINNSLREGKWIKNTVDKQCFMIYGKTVGIIGLGNIGKRVAKCVKSLDASVLYYDIKRLSPEAEKEFGLKYVEMKELLAKSDIVTVHVPLSEDTKHLIGEKEIALMKKTAVLINAARGGIVDEKALIKALKEGKLLCAGLDCFETEPIPADSPLLSLPNVTLSCHVGGNTTDLAFNLAKICPDNIRAFINGALEERFVVNRQFLVKK
jgi:phosphoglycerate dehydrogenase-like enzyme